MKLTRQQLRKLIKESMEADSGYGSVQPGSISELYGPGSVWARSWRMVMPVAILNHFRQHEAAYGTSADAYIQEAAAFLDEDQIEDVKAAIAASNNSPTGIPLTGKDTLALMISDKDPNSEYKLSLERLNTFWANPQLNSNDLTPEEQSIINR
ncbi:MAG TPA: hypothetical protein EYQ00_10995 [Dehalococcoidia bacterium]|nr:hypothetical protein [Dehalococcoidia bacterium]